MMFDVHIMTTWEAIRPFLTKEKKMLYEYNKTESYLNINLQNDISIQNFLDNDGRNYVKGFPEMFVIFLVWNTKTDIMLIHGTTNILNGEVIKMGTRHITIVKKSGEVKVQQYGQYDGYPTGALANIVAFIKTPGAVDKLRLNVDKCRFLRKDESAVYSKSPLTGDVNYDKVYEKDDHLRYAFATFDERITILSRLFGAENVLKYMISSRDTGERILNALVTEGADSLDEIPLYRAWTDKTGEDGEDAVNIIDLDNNRIISHWHDRTFEFDLFDPPIDEEIVSFERGLVSKKRFFDSLTDEHRSEGMIYVYIPDWHGNLKRERLRCWISQDDMIRYNAVDDEFRANAIFCDKSKVYNGELIYGTEIPIVCKKFERGIYLGSEWAEHNLW